VANVFTPNGFVPVRRVDGAAWTGNMSQYKIAQANNHSFFQGDPVIRLSTGYIDTGGAGTANAGQFVGIFQFCERLSTASGAKVWSNRFTGDANADVDVWIVDDPLVVYRAWVGTGTSSASGGPITQANLGNNVTYQYGTGSTQSGLSGAYLDFSGLTTTATLPWLILNTVTQPPGLNGTDVTTAGNLVEVVMNNSVWKSGVLGI
jgi:hypothetical protein